MLHHDVESACLALGMEPEGRPFRPHLTLARVPAGTGEPALRTLSRAARTVRYSEVVDAAAVDLMASELAPDGPRYRLLHSSPLGAAF
jgi:2'-5' RNA ligase